VGLSTATKLTGVWLSRFESREGKSFRGHVKKIISPFPEISYGFRTLHMWHGAIKIPCLSTLQNYPGLSLAAA